MAKTSGSSRSKKRDNSKTQSKRKNSSAINRATKPNTRKSNGHVSDAVLAVLSSSNETENVEVGVLSDVEEKPQNGRSYFEKQSKDSLGKIKCNQRNGGLKNESKRSFTKEEGEDGNGEAENGFYKFPMNRISRIIKSEHSDFRISQEAVFVINRAMEKFLELFSLEAYACAFLDRKSCIAYNHLSSVVSKRKRFDFVSDFIPEKMKSEDALAQIPETEK